MAVRFTYTFAAAIMHFLNSEIADYSAIANANDKDSGKSDNSMNHSRIEPQIIRFQSPNFSQ